MCGTKKGTAYQHQNIIPTVKYGGGNMIWACFSPASGPGPLAIIQGKINTQFYQNILQDIVRVAVCHLKLRIWVMQQDNDPMHRSKSTTDWASQSPDLNPIELLWNGLKRGVHSRQPTNVAELKQFCEDEWSKIPPERCAGLIHSYQKHLIEVIAAKGGLTRY